MFRNLEGYPDPTAGAAMKRILYEESLARRKAKKARRDAVRKRQAKDRRKVRPESQNVPTHWVKAWPKENARSVNVNMGVKK